MIKHEGFSLIEVIVVIALVGLLITVLFTSFMAGNRLTQLLDDEMDMYQELIIIERQCGRDIAGAFIPVQAEQQADTKKTEAGPTEQEKTAPQSAKKKKELKDPFVVSLHDGMLQTLSFISNNPMRVYWSESAGKPLPSVVRVVYTVEEDKEAAADKPRYILYRQEGTELALTAYRGVKSTIERYPLANAIKSIVVTCIVEQEKKSEKNTASSAISSAVSKERTTFTEWGVGEQDDVRTKVKLPTYVQMIVTLWDSSQESDRTFTLIFPIDAPYTPPQEKKRSSDPTPPARTPQPVAPAGQPPAPQRQQKVAQANRQQQLIQGAQSIIEELQGIFGGAQVAG